MKKSQNKAVKETATKFCEEMGSLLQEVTKYMEKWSTSTRICLEPSNFKQETTALVETLFNRIERENNDLFPLLLDQ